MDPLAVKLKMIFNDNNMIGIRPHTTVPTWYNGRAGTQHIAKIIYRYLVHEDMIKITDFLQTEVLKSFIGYHLPITLL